jgi:hypothetical protein
VFTWIHKSETNGEPILPIKIVYKKKFDSEGNIKQFKTRITVQGQRESSENMSTHAGTIYFCLILMLLCLAAMMELDLICFDVEHLSSTSSFLLVEPRFAFQVIPAINL